MISCGDALFSKDIIRYAVSGDYCSLNFSLLQLVKIPIAYFLQYFGQFCLDLKIVCKPSAWDSVVNYDNYPLHQRLSCI